MYIVSIIVSNFENDRQYWLRIAKMIGQESNPDFQISYVQLLDTGSGTITIRLITLEFQAASFLS